MDGQPTSNPAASRAKAFEVFVKRTISQIHKEAWGRSKEVRDLREACDKFLNALEAGGSKIPHLEEMVLQVLPPLQLACQTNIPKVVELSLGCLHKLVAHAWLQGESQLTTTGPGLSGDVVADVIKIVIKHADSNSQTLQLAVLRALLTFATAEHFVAHGDCLLSAVRTVFNLALSSIDSDIKRTAGNALLQMLNTITKRVTQYHFRSSRFSDTSSALSTPVSREAITPALPDATKDLRDTKPIRTGSVEVEAELISDQERAAQFKRMAEQRDMRGLERALEEAAARAAAEEAEAEAAGQRVGSVEATSAPASPGTPAIGVEAVQHPVTVQDEAGFTSVPNLPPLKTGAKPLRVPLSIVEKDVLLVLTAFCKLASCEPEKTNAEAYMQHGKVLALELLVKVLQNPHHNWGNVRDELFRHLRQPLCLALLKNCATGDPAAFNLAVKLLVGMLLLPKLRRGLRAEMGALYPLLILRAVEQYAGGWQEGVVDSAALLQLLQVLRSLCSDAQLLVDLFVNYDCDLNAANLYERTISALSRLCSTPHDSPNNTSASQQGKDAATTAAVSDAALQCLQAVINSLDAWAGPLKDSLTRSEVDIMPDSLAVEADLDVVSSPTSRTEAEVFGAAKAHKSSLTKGIDLFKGNPLKGIAFLISTGVIERSPVKVAEFLLANLSQLNKTALGEYLGHHEEFEMQVMHAFVDRQRYAGVKIDIALRGLLEQFRLPGEAQKIDRIMEKFAERYCKDNPKMFRNADAAYMLAFSVIMLNTDAHNPMAERMLNKATFLEMNRVQMDTGMEMVLPAEELEGIYDRIVSKEITLKGEGNDSRKSHQFILAAAVGLTQLVTPFRALAGSFGSKQSSAQLERLAILRQAEQALAQGTLSSVTWHIATHAEHTCPMLQVTGTMIFEALNWSLSNSSDVKQIEGVLSSLSLLIRLASLLGLDQLCEKCVAAVADATGVFRPAPPGTRQELIQLRAFKVLVGLPLSPEGGLLGSSWPIVLRCLAAVEALQLEHLKASQQPAKVDESANAKSLTKMFQALGLSINSTLGIKKPIAINAVSEEGEEGERKHMRDAAAVLLWAETEGQTLMERIYTQSSLLDGESVVVFVRALSAVSQEELELPQPRLFSLHKLVECAFHNMSRIRLVWSKVWSVVSAHLVGASCHTDARVAMYAVDSLKQLVTKLLARAELANFTHQVEALRPFVSVLRQCDHPAVRELTVQCVVQAATSHPRGLGSGWRMVIEAVTRGVRDSNRGVVLQAMEALQIVVGALYRGPGVGHECFPECLEAVLAAIRNPLNTQMAVSAVQLLLLCGERLADSGPPQGHKLYEEHVMTGWAPLLQAVVDLLSSDPRAPVVHACMEGLYDMMQQYTHCWDTRTWEVVLNQVLDILFRLPSVDVLSSPGEEEAVVELFTMRSTRFIPQICERLTLIEERVGSDLLQRLVGMTLAWTSHPSLHLSAAGLQAFEQMVMCLSPHMSSHSWLLLLSSLWVSVQALLNQMLAQFQQLLDIHSRTGLLQQPPSDTRGKEVDEPTRLLGNFHGRCQLMLLLQRTLGSIHGQCRQHMDAQVQLQLFRILKATVDTAISINHMSAAVLLPAMPAPVAPTNALGKHGPTPTSAGIKATLPSQRSFGRPDTTRPTVTPAKLLPKLNAGLPNSNASTASSNRGASPAPENPADSTPAQPRTPQPYPMKPTPGGNTKNEDSGGGVDLSALGQQSSGLQNGTVVDSNNVATGGDREDSFLRLARGDGTLDTAARHEDAGSGGRASSIGIGSGPISLAHLSSLNGGTPLAQGLHRPVSELTSPPESGTNPTSPEPEGSVMWSAASPASVGPRLPDEHTVTPRANAMRLTGPGQYGNMPEGFAALPPVATGSGPVVRSSPVGSDTVAPAVLRIEVQGGLLLISAYKSALAMSQTTPLSRRIAAQEVGTQQAGTRQQERQDQRPAGSSRESRYPSRERRDAEGTDDHANGNAAENGLANGNSEASAGLERNSGSQPSSSSSHVPDTDGSSSSLPPVPTASSSSVNDDAADTASPSLLHTDGHVLSDDMPLWEFCREVLTRAAMSVDKSPGRTLTAEQVTPEPTTDATTADNDDGRDDAANNSTENKNADRKQDKSFSGPGLTRAGGKICGWTRDAHAPLIGSALEVLQQLMSKDARERLLQVLPALIGLIQYRHPLVQAALAGLLEDKLGSVVAASCSTTA